MLIRGYLIAIDADRSHAIALFHITQHLVVGFVFLDDIYHMLKE